MLLPRVGAARQVAQASLARPQRRWASSARQVPEVTLAIIKPTVCVYEPNILHALRRLREHPHLQILRAKSFAWEEEEAAQFYAEHLGKFYYDRLILGMTAGRAIGLALSGPGAITEWRKLIGPTKAYRSAWEAPLCLRAELGMGDTRNGFHGSDSDESALHELGLVFPEWDAQGWLEKARM